MNKVKPMMNWTYTGRSAYRILVVDISWKGTNSKAVKEMGG
jgi:hypothetical protein